MESTSDSSSCDQPDGSKMTKSALKKAKKHEKMEKLKREKAAAAEARVASPKPGGSAGRKKVKPKEEKPSYELVTPRGEKKVLPDEMPPTYQPKLVEAACYTGAKVPVEFAAALAVGMALPESSFERGDEERSFTIVIPPPNVTGSLHLGHALTNSVEDCLTRWHRMCGLRTLWLPASDHAGIATQAVVEKQLRIQGTTRHELGREKFVERVWQWKEQYGNTIKTQLKRLGSSLDWKRERFTMDKDYYRAVQTAFVRLYEAGRIYRATRLVNWCCRLRTAVSELEVEYTDFDGPTKVSLAAAGGRVVEFGLIEHFRYEVAEPQSDAASDRYVEIATTRLETMLGDTGVAVHPSDKRYTHLHGARLIHPFFPDRDLRIVTDEILVDPEFGTGIVKITPAHDPNDYLAGQRNKLEFINILTDDGMIAENAGGSDGQFAGMDRWTARNEVRKALQARGLWLKKEPNPMHVGRCHRTGDVIEPLLRPQWFVDCKELGNAALEAVCGREGQADDVKPPITITPSSEVQTWRRWLEGIHDWCISRQLWWGHRVPAWFIAFKQELGEIPAGVEAPLIPETSIPQNEVGRRWVVALTEDEAQRIAGERYPKETAAGEVALLRDPDVLDTWFSSGIFPFAVFGWPDEAANEAAEKEWSSFYPNSVLETGRDILFFWVARMVMMGLALTGRAPFQRVLLHSMVRDAHGRKMSKSLGNVVDPVLVMEGISLEGLHDVVRSANLEEKEKKLAIAGQNANFPKGISECGADALRFALMAYMTQGRDINLDIQRVVGYRQFCNKLWNAVRFAVSHLKEAEKRNVFSPADTESSRPRGQPAPLACRWILNRLSAAADAASTSLDAFEPGNAVQALYTFWLNELCDVFLELCKPHFNVPEDGENETRTAHRKAFLQTLHACIHAGLRLLHPFMPFVTEELFQFLPRAAGEAPSISLAPYPRAWKVPADLALKTDADMGVVMSVVRCVRSMRGTLGIIPRARPQIRLVCSEAIVCAQLGGGGEMNQYITALGGAADVQVREVALADQEAAGCCVGVASEILTVYLVLEGLEGFDLKAQIARLNVKKTTLETGVEKFSQKIGDKVPAQVRETAQKQLDTTKAELEGVMTALAMLRNVAGAAENKEDQ